MASSLRVQRGVEEIHFKRHSELSESSLKFLKRLFFFAPHDFVGFRNSLELDHLVLSLLVTSKFEVLASLDDQKLLLLRLNEKI